MKKKKSFGEFSLVLSCNYFTSMIRFYFTTFNLNKSVLKLPIAHLHRKDQAENFVKKGKKKKNLGNVFIFSELKFVKCPFLKKDLNTTHNFFG